MNNPKNKSSGRCKTNGMYIQVKDGFKTRKQARQWIEAHKNDKEFSEWHLIAAKG